MARLGGNGEHGRLDGPQIKAFQDALKDAFDNLEKLEEFLLHYRNLHREDISLNRTLPGIIGDVIKAAESESWTAELLEAAREAEPTNAALIDFAILFGLTAITTDRRNLERLIRKANSFFDVEPWLVRAGEMESRVCRVEVRAGADLERGTGFLLGPDLVMTNYHVIEKVIKGQAKPEGVELRFDFKMLADGSSLNPGTTYHLAETDWLADQSEYSEHDLTNITGGLTPRPDQLDYALLRVAGTPGNDPVGGSQNVDTNAKPRGWIEVPDLAPTFQPNTALFILQHPNGQPLKLVFDTDAIIEVNKNNTRVRYKTNTDGGSSGSPCFDANWQLVALHQSGDPNFSEFHKPEYNEGIPVWAIRELLQKRGKLDLLGKRPGELPLRPTSLNIPKKELPPQTLNFVGRQAELAKYQERINKFHLATILGFPGTGKTSLASKLYGKMPDHSKLFWHSFHEHEGDDVVIWLIAAFLASHGQVSLWHSLQRRQNPNLLPPPIEIHFNDLVDLARQRGYLFFFDEFQFVQGLPLIALLTKRFLEEASQGTLSFVITSRQTPASLHKGESVSLSGLDPVDMGKLLESYGLRLSDRLVKKLHKATGGNPMVLHLAMDAMQQSTIQSSSIDKLSEIDDVRFYLMKEVRGKLSAPQRNLMSAVAVLQSYGGTRDAIEATCGMRDIDSILIELTDRHLLSTRNGSEKEYYQNELLQKFFYNRANRDERELLHRRAAKYYEEQARDLLKAARHYLLSRDYRHAVELVTTNVWEALNQGKAGTFLMLIKQLDTSKLDLIQRALINIAGGQAFIFVGKQKQSRQSYQKSYSTLVSVPTSARVREIRARACRGLGESWQDESPRQAAEWYQRGLAALGNVKTSERSALYIKMGSIQSRMGDFDSAVRILKKGLSLLPKGPSQLRAGALINLGMTYGQRGNLGNAIKYLQAARDISEQLQDYFQLLIIQSNLGIWKEQNCEWDAAFKDYRDALALAGNLGNIAEQARIINLLGLLYLNRGSIEMAEDHLKRSIELARHYNLRLHLIFPLINVADLQLRLGNWRDAERPLNEAEKLVLELRAKVLLPEIYTKRALIGLASGEIKASRKIALDSVKLARSLDMQTEQGKALRVLGQIEFARSKYELALRACKNSLAVLTRSDFYEAALTRAQLGLTLISMQDQKNGKRQLLKARETFQNCGAKRDLSNVDDILKTL